MKQFLPALIAFGGIGAFISAIAGYLAAHSDGMAHWMIEKILEDKKASSILLQYREDIEEVFDNFDKELKASLDAKAAQANQPVPPSPAK